MTLREPAAGRAPGARDLAAASAALRSLRRSRTVGRTDDGPLPVLPLADEAWFYEMLLVRFASLCPEDTQGWRDRRDVLLDDACALPADASRGVGEAAAHGADTWGADLLGAAMLAHLLRVRRPGEAAAEWFVGQALEACARSLPAADRLSPLDALCLAYNLDEMGEHAMARALPVPVTADEAAAGLTGPERLLTQAYFHTHAVLFAFGTFRRTEADARPLRRNLRFLRRHAPTFERYGWADLCAESALCLSLCGARDEDFHRLVTTLLRLQRPQGDWNHPRIDARQARHSTMLAALALLESARASAAAPDAVATAERG
uniref:FAD-binding monooxygenase n=1 Tax=Streptomyces nobilis TaxID=66901 RepID=I2CME4_9ACTN|nr:FAD-binding monooxygenase [Streptomyces nobilis]